MEQDSSFAGTKSTGTARRKYGNGFGDSSNYAIQPSGYLALCTANLPISSDIDLVSKQMTYHPVKLCNAVTYTGTGSARTKWFCIYCR